MPLITQPLSVSFGPAKTGQVGNVGYKVIDASGNVQIARTTAGITERVDASGTANTGVYETVATFNTAWNAVRVVWDITGISSAVAEETINIVVQDATSASYPHWW